MKDGNKTTTTIIPALPDFAVVTSYFDFKTGERWQASPQLSPIIAWHIETERQPDGSTWIDTSPMTPDKAHHASNCDFGIRYPDGQVFDGEIVHDSIDDWFASLPQENVKLKA